MCNRSSSPFLCETSYTYIATCQSVSLSVKFWEKRPSSFRSCSAITKVLRLLYFELDHSVARTSGMSNAVEGQLLCYKPAS